MSYPPHIVARWEPRRDVTLGEYIEMLKKYFGALQKLHPVFRQLYETGNRPNSIVAIKPDFSNLEVHLRKRLYDKECRYSHIASDGLPALDSTCSSSYSTSYMSHPKDTLADLNLTTTVDLSTGGGAGVDFPLEGAPEFYDYDFQKKLFQLHIDFFKPYNALIFQYNFWVKTTTEDDMGTGIRVGTITYFADKRIADAIPEDVEREPFGDGVLVTISRERPDPDNAKQVRDVKRVRDILHAKGLLKWI
jgi:hypothetical protein